MFQPRETQIKYFIKQKRIQLIKQNNRQSGRIRNEQHILENKKCIKSNDKEHLNQIG